MLRLMSRHWVEDEYGRMVIGEGRVKILSVVEATGSLTEAAKELGMSYRAIWGKLKSTESALHQGLVDSTKAKGSVLTPLAKELIRRYEEFNKRCRVVEEGIFKELFGDLGPLSANGSR